MMLVPGDCLWCQHLVKYILACYEENKSTDMLAAWPSYLKCCSAMKSITDKWSKICSAGQAKCLCFMQDLALI